jgi:hypothetical protein
VSELPWLDRLIRLADVTGNDRNGILNRNLLDWRIHQKPDELKCGICGLSSLRVVLEPTNARNRQIRARWVGNHKIPPVPENLDNIILDVRSRPL